MRYEVVGISLDADTATASIPAVGYELDDDNSDVSCACDEAIARCLAEQLAVEQQGVARNVKLKSYLEAASSASKSQTRSAKISNKELDVEYGQRNNAADLEEAGLRAEKMPLTVYQQDNKAANLEEAASRAEKIALNAYRQDQNAADLEKAALRAENSVLAYRRESNAADLVAAARRAERMALFARQEMMRCRPDVLGRDRAAAMRARMNELRDESCACYLAACNLHLVLPPIPRRFDSVVAAIGRSIANLQEPRLDLHYLPRVEALKMFDSAITGLSDSRSNARRLEVIVGRGVHSKRQPVLGSTIVSHLNKLGFQYQHDVTKGLLSVHLHTSDTHGINV